MDLKLICSYYTEGNVQVIKIIRRSQTSGKPVKCRNSLRIDIFRKNWSEKDGRSFFLFATLSKIPLHMKPLKICQTDGAYFRRRWYAVYDDKLTQAACLIDGNVDMLQQKSFRKIFLFGLLWCDCFLWQTSTLSPLHWCSRSQGIHRSEVSFSVGNVCND